MSDVEDKFPDAIVDEYKPSAENGEKQYVNGQAAENESAETLLDRRGFIFDVPRELVAPKERIKDLVPFIGSGVIGGQSGAGKTAANIDMDISLASGQPFFGREVREPCGVVSLVGEGAGRFEYRWRAAKHHRGIERPLPFIWREFTGNLLDEKEMKGFLDELHAADEYFRNTFALPMGVVSIDTAATCFVMQDENSNAEIQQICNVLNQIARTTKTYTKAVHHFGKNAEAGLRGGSAWRGGVDIVNAVLADRDEVTGKCSNRRISITKNRDGPEGPLGSFDLEFVELGRDEYGEPFGSVAVEHTGDVEASASRGKSPAKSHTVFHDAFREAAFKDGCQHFVQRDGPAVEAVPLEAVKAEFWTRWATGETDPKKQQENRKKAFSRAVEKLVDMRAFATEIRDGKEWIWKL